MKKFIIKYVPTGDKWLDGFDGEKYEWTTDRKTAWRFTQKQAEERQILVNEKIGFNITKIEQI